jgi:predicted acetyltransferase
MFGAFEGSQLVASARFHNMRQWWQGRSMPMAGVGGVKVAPEYRGRGVGRALMNGLVPELVARGYPVSTLYPATAPLYRSLGWELAGGRYETTVSMQKLARLLAPDQAVTGPAAGDKAAGSPAGLRRAAAADAAVVAETVARVYESLRECGPAAFDLSSTEDWLDDDHHFAYLADDGFLSYRWVNVHESIRVEVLAAASAPTARSFWQLLASHGTMADEVRACLAPDDPVSWLIAEPVAAVRQAWKWMLRLIDIPAAVAARGFPAAVEASVLLEVADDVLPVNSGRWRLEVSDGSGKIARVGPPSPAAASGTAGEAGQVLRLGARGIAALYAGVPVATLRRAGLASGGDQATDDALDSAFGGRPAFMVHDF